VVILIQPDPRELSFRRIDSTTIEPYTRRNGQITVTRRIQLSNDGPDNDLRRVGDA